MDLGYLEIQKDIPDVNVIILTRDHVRKKEKRRGVS